MGSARVWGSGLWLEENWGNQEDGEWIGDSSGGLKA